MEAKLDERKKKILNAVIKNYLETGEPVGSRTISKIPGFDVSPATIRNGMSDLEDEGYIFQPHTSAGRIPTDKGYRFYVDEMLESRAKEKAEEDTKSANEAKKGEKSLSERIDEIEDVLMGLAKNLANSTNYTSVISMPDASRNKLRFVQLTQLEKGKLLCTIVLEGNVVRNQMIAYVRELSQEELLRLNILLNNTLNGLTLAEINFDMAARMASTAKEDGELVSDILNAIVQAIGAEDGIEIFTSGATNIFKYPELSDIENAKGLLTMFEEKKLLGTLLEGDESLSENTTGIQVYIGDENANPSMKDCSVVTATYEFEEGVYGKIGVVGPKRMDYEKVMDALKDVTSSLDKKFS